MMKKTLVTAILAVGIATAGHPALAVPLYTVTDLGTLSGNTIGSALNDNGQAVGYSDNGSAFEAFIWDSTNGIQGLGSLSAGNSRAYDINNNGQVVGYYHDTYDNPFIWDSTDGMQDLPEHAVGNSYARAINDSGVIAGLGTTLYDPHPVYGAPFMLQTTHALTWDPSGTLTDIMPGEIEIGYGYGINEAGLIVGTVSYDSTPYIWDPVTGYTLLDTLGGGYFHIAFDINNNGLVVGVSTKSIPTDYAAVLWDEFGIHDLGVLPGGSWSFANALNDVGQVVGDSSISGNPVDGITHGFLWDDVLGMLDLNDLILDAGWTISGATDINAMGQILASAHNEQGETRAVILSPFVDDPVHVPEPATLALVGAGLFGIHVTRRRKKIA